MLRVAPISLADANRYVAKHHSHHEPVRGHKFSIAAYEGDRLCGVVIVGRPVARKLDDGTTLEITRCCTDRTPHAASKLIAAATRAAFAMGAVRMVSYVLAEEEGVSYRAAGWTRQEQDGEPVTFGGGDWSVPSRPRGEPMAALLGLEPKYPQGPKHRWEKHARPTPTPEPEKEGERP